MHITEERMGLVMGGGVGSILQGRAVVAQAEFCSMRVEDRVQGYGAERFCVRGGGRAGKLVESSLFALRVALFFPDVQDTLSFAQCSPAKISGRSQNLRVRRNFWGANSYC
jgi:hypothetical protein